MNSTSSSATAPSRAALREAAQWLVRLNSGQARADDWQALAAWRAQDGANEQGWQRAERLSRTFGAVPAGLGLPVLARAERTAATNRRAALRVLALVGTTAPAAYLGWRHMPWQQWAAEHRTATGERRSVTLADGSEVLLNTASALDVAFDANERLLRLRAGEVLITTARESAARSFRVETPGGWLRALGTRFAVRLLHEDTVHLAVAEGAVEITPRHGAQRVLQAGAQCRFTARGVQAPTALGEQTLAWAQGVLYADGMRLDDFAAELARYRPGVVRCDPAVAALRISGAFQLQDTEYILAMLRETLPVQVVTRTRYWVTLVPA
ncbi:MAG: FecR domain-containing protein [Pseudomonadota bacterium]